MWEACLEKLARLRNLDRRYQAFGAENHGYVLKPCVSDERVESFESDNNFKLPDELRSFYTQVGNGVAGPEYGLTAMERLDGFHPHLPYKDIATLKQKYGGNVSRFNLAGLVGIVEHGCGHLTCLVTAGEKVGKIVYVYDGGGAYETEQNFAEYYEAWLDKTIEQFEFIEKMMRDGAPYEEIKEKLLEKYDSYDAGDIISSIADTEKPVELFGTRFVKKYHGALQEPWYAQVLEDWRARNL